jgi:hypothetical protein
MNNKKDNEKKTNKMGLKQNNGSGKAFIWLIIISLAIAYLVPAIYK